MILFSIRKAVSLSALDRRKQVGDRPRPLVIALWLFVVSGIAPGVQATEYFVDVGAPNASDQNNGSETHPWKTLSKATQSARAGDTVSIMAGTYTEGLYVDQHSGRSGARIVFRAHPDAVGSVVLNGRCVKILQQSHIEIRSLKIQNCDRVNGNDHRGVTVRGPGVTDIVISGNHTINTWSSAISVWGVPWKSDPGDFRNITNIIIENNVIEQANNGGYDEQITLANGVEDFIIRNNELKNAESLPHGGQGIDVKEGCAHGKIYNNHIYGFPRRAIYIDGGGRSPFVSPTHDIELYGNVLHDVPNGFAIMSEGGGDVYNIKFYNNLIYNIDSDCAFIYDHPNAAADPGKFWNIEFVNNTFWNCSRNSIDINSSYLSNVLIRNNIFDGRIVDRTSGAVTKDHNLEGVEVGFIDASSGNYRIKSESPAVDVGYSANAPSEDLEGHPRPCGDNVDIGAFEFRSAACSVPSTPMRVCVAADPNTRACRAE